MSYPDEPRIPAPLGREVVNYNPAQLNHAEILSLLARGLIEYLERVSAGEVDPFPYPDALLRGFNQLLIACALQEVDRAKRPKSIPEFVQIWATLPLVAWPLKLQTPYSFTVDDYLVEPDLGDSPTQLCQRLATQLKVK